MKKAASFGIAIMLAIAAYAVNHGMAVFHEGALSLRFGKRYFNVADWVTDPVFVAVIVIIVGVVSLIAWLGRKIFD